MPKAISKVRQRRRFLAHNAGYWGNLNDDLPITANPHREPKRKDKEGQWRDCPWYYWRTGWLAAQTERERQAKIIAARKEHV